MGNVRYERDVTDVKHIIKRIDENVEVAMRRRK
jgi:hypothetical protein